MFGLEIIFFNDKILIQKLLQYVDAVHNLPNKLYIHQGDYPSHQLSKIYILELLHKNVHTVSMKYNNQSQYYIQLFLYHKWLFNACIISVSALYFIFLREKRGSSDISWRAICVCCTQKGTWWFIFESQKVIK